MLAPARLVRFVRRSLARFACFVCGGRVSLLPVCGLQCLVREADAGQLVHAAIGAGAIRVFVVDRHFGLD